MQSQLDEVLARLGAMPPAQRAAVAEEAYDRTSHLKFIPNAGPQTAAYYSQADELFYGGEAGGGKSELIIGLALNCHTRSLILREFKEDARGLGNRLVEMVGSSDGWNEQMARWRTKRQAIVFDGLPNEKDKEHHKGKPYDFHGFDEIGDFYESQYVFIIAWNRTTDLNQRCRIVVTGNPPTRAKGLWVIKRWGPWLDPKHPRPASDGELRWFITDTNGEDTEVDGPGPFLVDGRETRALSRTFIRAKLSDNPDLARTDYDATLGRLPKELRDAYREGRFDAALKDHPFQVIPTSWIRAANARWTERPPDGVPMCAIGVDVGGGGRDKHALAARHDAWYAKVITLPSKDAILGSEQAAWVVKHRRNEAEVIIDMGGGYGGPCYQRLSENGIKPRAHKGAEKSTRRTRDGKLRFVNKRTEAYWQFREDLDPDQEGGSVVALPEDQELLADLTAPNFEVSARGIEITSKEDVCKLLGRSPDKGDAVIMARTSGARAFTTMGASNAEQRGYARNTGLPKVDLGPRRRGR